MNAKNRRLLITGGALGLLLGLTFGGLTFAEGPVFGEWYGTGSSYDFRKARQNELMVAAATILGSAVAITCGIAITPTNR